MSLGKRELGEQPAGQFSIKLRMDGASSPCSPDTKFIQPPALRESSATKDLPTPPKKRKDLAKSSAVQPKAKEKERRVEEEERDEKDKAAPKDLEEMEKRLKAQESVAPGHPAARKQEEALLGEPLVQVAERARLRGRRVAAALGAR